MLRAVNDLANAITTVGIVLTTCGIYLILPDDYHLAIFLLIWAVMLDHLDGYVARKRMNFRTDIAKKSGKDMDSFTDVISGSAPLCTDRSTSG